jgi:hypothetical protein
MNQEISRNIRTGIAVNQGETPVLVEGKMKWNPNFLERLYDYQGYFTILLEDDINSALGEVRWSLFFSQVNPLTSFFLVDISVSDLEFFPVVRSIIESKIPQEFKLEFFLKPKDFSPVEEDEITKAEG